MSAHSEEQVRLARRAVLGGVLGFGLQATLADNVAMAAPLDLPDVPDGARPGAPGSRPRVYTRKQWKAKAARRPARVLTKPPDHIVVHHTATPNSADRSLDHAYDLSRAIQRFHMKSRGWDDTGQQLTISRGGHIMEGRNRSLAAIAAGRHVVGAQALNHNEHTIGIENEGNYMTTKVPARLWDSLVDTCAWLCTEYRLDPYRAIVGHRDYGNTNCPGDVLYARLPELRRVVAKRLGLPAKTKTTKPQPAKPKRDAPTDSGESERPIVSNVFPELRGGD